VSFEWQQAPVGGWGQGLGLQTPPCSHEPTQPTCVVTVQKPNETQQAPVGGGQGIGLQGVLPCQVPVHPDCNVIVQAPSAAQHAPLGGGGGKVVVTVTRVPVGAKPPLLVGGLPVG